MSKRPWNAALKTLCWKLGESFVKVQSNEADVYGKLYAQRKAEEIIKNEAGDFADQARAVLEKKKLGHSTDAYKWYIGRGLAEQRAEARLKNAKTRDDPKDKGKGKTQTWLDGKWVTKAAFLKKYTAPEYFVQALPPAHIHARAKRFAVKIFLSHFHEVWYELHHKKPAPSPYPIANMPGHVHKIDPVRRGN